MTWKYMDCRIWTRIVVEYWATKRST